MYVYIYIYIYVCDQQISKRAGLVQDNLFAVHRLGAFSELLLQVHSSSHLFCGQVLNVHFMKGLQNIRRGCQRNLDYFPQLRLRCFHILRQPYRESRCRFSNCAVDIQFPFRNPISNYGPPVAHCTRDGLNDLTRMNNTRMTEQTDRLRNKRKQKRHTLE